MRATTDFRNIPYDVLCCLMEHLDMDTLKTASLVNHDFKHEADKHIWGSFRIVVDDARVAANVREDNRGADNSILTYGYHVCEILKEGCRIACAGARATRLRRFSVMVDRWSATESDTTVVLETLFYTLRQFPSLRRLELDLWFTLTPYTRSLMSSLTRDRFPFQLEHFAIEIRGDLEGCLHQFLCSQKLITSLHLSHDSLTDRLEEDSLPRLTHLRVANAFQSVIARNRPVTHLCIDEVLRRTADVFANISQSTLPFQLLWCRASWFLGTFIGPLAQHSSTVVVPHVRCLVLEYHFPLCEVPPAAFHALALFTSVEELIWEVYTRPPALEERERLQLEVENNFFEICSSRCVSLRKITFSHINLPANSFFPSRSYRRRWFGDDWEIVEEHASIQPSLSNKRHLFPAMPY